MPRIVQIEIKSGNIRDTGSQQNPHLSNRRRKKQYREGANKRRNSAGFPMAKIYSLKFLSLHHPSCTYLCVWRHPESQTLFLILPNEMPFLIWIFTLTPWPPPFLILLIFGFPSRWPLFLHTNASSLLWLFSPCSFKPALLPDPPLVSHVAWTTPSVSSFISFHLSHLHVPPLPTPHPSKKKKPNHTKRKQKKPL